MSKNFAGDIGKDGEDVDSSGETNFSLLNWHTAVIIVAAMSIFLKNPTVRYYFNYTFFFAMIIITCIVNTPLLLLRPKNPSNFIVVYPFARFTALVLGIGFELQGGDILAKEQAAVLIANHQSALDVLAHCCIMNIIKKCVVVSRIELFYILPYAIFMTLAGSIFINRKNGKSANENLLSSTPVLAKHKAKLLIYPEGHRYINAEVLLPFKKGAFRVAIEGQFPIIPMIISPLYFIDPKKKLFRSGNITMKVLDPISTEGLTVDDMDSLVSKTWNIMNDEYQKLRAEVESYKIA